MGFVTRLPPDARASSVLPSSVRRQAFACALLIVLLGAVRTAVAVPYGIFNRPEDSYEVAETKYFRFFFTEKTPKTVAYLMRIADATFERLNRFYGYRPARKITVSIVSYTGYSNAFADSQRDRITIYPTPANFHSRRRVPWLANVFTHELSHILSLNTASPWSKRVPLVLGTGVVRSAQNQTLFRLPIYPHNYPHWFAEGVAQFDTALLGRDSFDENRASYQRAAYEDGLLFPLGKLAFFGREKWYNTGFSFLRYIERRFGRGSVHRLFKRAGEQYYYVFDGVFEDVLGVPLDRLEVDFRAEVARGYNAHFESVHRGRYDGQPLKLEGQDISYAELTAEQRENLSDDYAARPLRVIGDQLFYRQNEMIHRATFSAKRLELTKTKTITEGFAFAPHTRNSYVVLRTTHDEPSLLPTFYRPEFESASLILVDEEGNERVLSDESRLHDLDICPKRRELAGVYNDGDGSLMLALYPLDGFGTEQLALRTESVWFPLPPQDRDEVRTPRYSPDCSKLFFSRRVGDDHDIFYWDFSQRKLVTFAAEDAFELYPSPTQDGAYFVSARDGSLSVYFKRYDGKRWQRITEAVTSHHYPLATSEGVLFSRERGTGFQAYFLPSQDRSKQSVSAHTEKAASGLSPVQPPTPLPSTSYSGFSPSNWLAPSFLPLLDMEYNDPGIGGGGLYAQAGIEVYIEDQLRTHSVWFRGFAGNRSSFWLNYRNDMTPLTLQGRVSFNSIRSLTSFERSDGQNFDHVSDYRWATAYASATLPLNLFYSVTVDGETIRDIGSTTGARARLFDLQHPRFARDAVAARVAFSGIDRSDPTFREREVNKRGYREFDLSVAYAVEEVHPLLQTFDETLTAGRSPYARVELSHREFIALPTLMRGFFDHTLQIDVRLGYISKDVRFLPFYGGGRLYSYTIAELNTSVGFSGYSSFSIRGESLVNVGATYRFPLARDLGWDYGPFFLHDIYAQLFTSWGNIWGFDPDGTRQRPFLDRAPNGQYVLGDFGADLRFLSFFQEGDANVGTTLRVAYRAVPFVACPDANVAEDPRCLGVDGQRGLMYYVLLGGGF